jgi:hypothetical protein
MRRLVVWLLAALAMPALAETPVVTSSGPDHVAVTVYREPERGFEEPLRLGYLTSFALIAETRTVTLPPGQVTVRFEGVASGIVPQTAILFGTDPRERNRDAALLSQKGLVDAFTGQRVQLRRTDRATGKVTIEPATIRSAADRLLVATAGGIEALYCSGLNQTLIYPNAPATLSAKPVLSMTTKDQPGGTVTITLAYLATGFDWDATYVGTLAPDGKSLSLLAWLTLASADDTSFPDATTSAVAGRVNRSEDTRDDAGRQAVREAGYLNRSFGCWPAGTTSDMYVTPSAAAPPMVVAFARAGPGDEIVVTARRVEEKAAGVPIAVTAKSESLGDLKLYRIPVPVTVAARSQKQVAFLLKPRVTGAIIHRARMSYGDPDGVEMLFRFRNRKQDGLGEPLPGGKAILYQHGGPGRLFVGETFTGDKAVDEEVELKLGESREVTIEDDEADDAKDHRIERHVETIRNANPFAVTLELEFPTGEELTYRFTPARRLTAKPGKRVLTLTIPANGTTRLAYTTREQEDEE